MDKAIILKEVTAGHIIQTIRKEKGMSQKQLAEVCGISEKILSLYERGAVDVPLKRLERILQSMGVEVVMSISEVGKPC